MPVELPQTFEISEGDVEIITVRCTDHLDEGELLTGTPVFSELVTSDLTFSSEQRNSIEHVYANGDIVAVDKGAQCVVSGQLAANSPYNILVTVTTDADMPLEGEVRTFKRVAVLRVR